MNYSNTDTLNSLLSQIIRSHHTRAHMLFQKIGLSRGQPPIISMLSEEDGLTQKEISEKLHLTPATITDTLQRMEKLEFLERKPDSKDLRVTRVYLTEKGKALQSEIIAIRNTIENDFFQGFTLEEKLLLRRFFLQIRDNIFKALDENPPQ